MADYETWLARRGLAAKTVTQWLMVERRFGEWWGEEPWTATSADIERWLWDAQPHLSSTSRRNYRKGLRSLWRWGIREGFVDCDPLEDVPNPRERVLLPDPVPTELVRRALDQAGPQMRVAVTLAAFGGLRCAEIAALEAGDVAHGTILVHGKGGRDRRVPVHPEIVAALEALPAGPGLVLGWSAPMVSQRGCGYLRAIGVTVRRPMHGLRAWYATRLYESSGHDLLLVRDMLGHASTNTTALYAAVARDAAASAVAQIAA